jgi:hypothetical protein
VETLPELPGRLYALGTAELRTSEGEAIARASDRARLEVVARLRATVQGQTRISTQVTQSQRSGGPAAAAADRQVRDEVRVSARAEDLPGLVVERTHCDPAARTAYALACLDLAQAGTALGGRLDRARDARLRLGAEVSRRARWRMRKELDDLDGLDATLDLLEPAGLGRDLRGPIQAERAAATGRLHQMDGEALPPLVPARTATALRTNVDLPLGIEAYLQAQIRERGLLQRNLNPDLVLDLSFFEGSRGAEFIRADVDLYSGTIYRIEATLTVLEGSGMPLTRPMTLQLSQAGSPEGMVEQFRRAFERRLPRLVAEALAAFQ